MSEPIGPMSAREKRILELAGPFEPPTGAEQRVFEALKVSMAAPVAASVAIGIKSVVLIAGAMFAGGVLLGRTAFAPEPLPPQIVERVVRVEVPAPAVAAAEPEPIAVVKKAPKVDAPDALLARERERIDTARSALLHSDAAAAIASLQAHLDAFPTGRLAEERESLWVQALVMGGAVGDAKARAARFHEKFPRSLLGPAVDAALGEPEK